MIEELAGDLEEAKARIIENRLLAWCSGNHAQSIGKLALLPLTGQAWVDLKIIDNKMVCDGEPNESDLMEYIWRNSEDYSPEASATTEKAKRKIGHLFGKSENDELIKTVLRHLNDAFAEIPEHVDASSKTFSRDNRMPAIEGIIGAIDEVAARYGQNPSEVLQWSMNRIFQLQKAIRLATIPDYKLAEPRLIKMIKQEILTEINNVKSRT